MKLGYFPPPLGGEYKGVLAEDLPEELLPRAAASSAVRADHYLLFIDKRLQSAEWAGHRERTTELRMVALALQRTIGKTPRPIPPLVHPIHE